MALAKAGHSVLVTADSNAAVDNLVVGLRRSGFLAVRVGHAPNIRDENVQAARIDPLDAPLFVRWAAEQGIVVATTNYGAFRYIDPKGGLSPFIFDYVIHDEAGQATAPSSLAAVMRGRRLVLAGDPKQLPPTVVAIDAKEAGLDVTLFERIEELTGKGRTKMLETQFRMREPIVAFSNKRYYEGRLETHASAAAQDGLPDLPAAAFQHVTGRENERQRNGSISNDFEVDAVVQLVEKTKSELRERGWTMAVLTPYQAQREAIRRRLPDIEVSTVDGAQGREWDVVLYSTVRSNPQHRLGFLEDERRLNVAVTRAKRNFILIGDERTLGDHPAFQALLDSTEKVRLLDLPRPGEGRRDDRDRGDRYGDRRGGRHGDRRFDERGRRHDRRDRNEHRGHDRQERDQRRDDDRSRQQPRDQPREPRDAARHGDRGEPRQPNPPREKPDPKVVDFVEPFQAPRRSRESFVVPVAGSSTPPTSAPPAPAPAAPPALEPAPAEEKPKRKKATKAETPAAPEAAGPAPKKKAKQAKLTADVADAPPEPKTGKAAKATKAKATKEPKGKDAKPAAKPKAAKVAKPKAETPSKKAKKPA
jgi:hypothetical protein